LKFRRDSDKEKDISLLDGRRVELAPDLQSQMQPFGLKSVTVE
jgi:hypothetical protein